MRESHVPPLEAAYLEKIIQEALQEDIGHGDVTTESLVDATHRSRAQLLAGGEAILAGLEVFQGVFRHLDPRSEFTFHRRDGQRVERGEIVLEMEARTEALFKGERAALNFLQHLSGIATRTGLFLARLEGLPVTLLDTRKTRAGLRALEKYAVRIAGGGNHRFGLFDGILVKDNHRKVIADLPAAVAHLKRLFPLLAVEVECENLDEVRGAMEAGADILLLDNMSVEDLRRAVAKARGCCRLEASGNIGLGNVREVAETGVDFVSVGSVIHGATFVDFSLEVVARADGPQGSWR
jgi:nicotinate-nucleotide pyrophosphorylase (carboxylating)